MLISHLHWRAVYWARIEQIYVSVDRQTAARFGFDDALFYQEIEKPMAERVIPCQMGILPHESEAIFVQWQLGAFALLDYG